MTAEYKPNVREDVPEGLEYKSTADTLIGHTPAQVPHSSRTGESVTDDERDDAQIFPGTFAAGNGVQNTNVRKGSGGDGLATDSGGRQRSGRGVTGAKTSTGSSAAKSSSASKSGDAGKTEVGTAATTKTGDGQGSA